MDTNETFIVTRLLILSQHLFRVSILHPHTITKTAMPLVNCIVNDGLVNAMPNMHRTLLEFVNVVHHEDMPMTDTLAAG